MASRIQPQLQFVPLPEDYCRSLCAAHQGRLQGLAYWMLRDERAAASLTQAVLLEALRRESMGCAPQGAAVADPQTLGDTLDEVFVEFLRPCLGLQGASTTGAPKALAGHLSEEFTTRALPTALRILLPLERLIFVLHERNHNSLDRISQLLSLDRVACGRILFRARMQLRNALVQ